MKKTTLRLWVSGKQPYEEGHWGTLSLTADYGDGRNSEWASATPSASLLMTVKGEILDGFEMGDKVDVELTVHPKATEVATSSTA